MADSRHWITSEFGWVRDASGYRLQRLSSASVGRVVATWAVVALGGLPMLGAPRAQADMLDAMDQMFAPLLDVASNPVEADPMSAWAAWAGLLDQVHGANVSDGLSAASAEATDLSGWFEQVVYAPLHVGMENWINSDLGQQLDGVLNALLGSYAIGDGAAGTVDHPDGGAGGWLFGDGGAGWNSTGAGLAGGAGGAAGIFGEGGVGGAGGAGAAGGAGGDGGWLLGVGGAGGDGGQGPIGGIGGHGGDGGWLFGMGGQGGAGGDGGTGGHGGDGGVAIGLLGNGGNGGHGGESGIGSAPTGLPALGGAGGNGSWLGNHGAVGQFGTGVPITGASGGFSTAGTWITDGDGRVVILHGLDEVYKAAPYEPSAAGFDDDDAAFLAANGFNSVGLGIIWAALEPEPGVFNQAYLDSIAQTIQTLGNHGIVVTLGMHQDLYSTEFGGEGAPDWAVQTGGLPNPNFGFPNNYYLNPANMYAWDSFWSNAPASDGMGLENHYALAWEYVADYFKDDPNVVGLNIMAEPSAGSQWLSSMLGNPHFDAQQLTPFYNQVTSAIRAVDPNTTVYFQHNVNFDLGFPTHLGTVDDPNKAFLFAYFCPTSLLGDGLFCDVLDEWALNNVVDYAGAQNIPALMGGFGATDNIAVLTDMLQGASQRHYSWTEWAYTGKGDITTGASSLDSEALVLDPSKPPVGDNVNTTILTALSEPYPQAVSGTPNSWSYDHGVFQLSYSTVRADGAGTFAAGAQTNISVPAIQYPNGYQVSVTGGHVVSAPNAPVLIVASDSGATTVSVTVNPAA